MYHVVLCLDSNLSEYDPKRIGPQTVAQVKTLEEAQAVMAWVERDLQGKNFYVDHLRCLDNDGFGWEHTRAIFERKAKYPKPDIDGGIFFEFPDQFERYMNDDLNYIGCVFYYEKANEPQA